MYRTLIDRNLVVALLCSALITSCNHKINPIAGSGQVVSEKRNISNFHSVEAGRGMEVELSQSDAFEVTVTADDNIINNITTDVEGGVLKISQKNGGYFNVKSQKVIVKMPELRRVTASGGVTITSAGPFLGKKVQIDASGGSSVKMEVEADELVSESSRGSSVTLTGKALKVDVSASSGSRNDAGGLMVNDAVANASSGSSIHVQPIVNLTAEASSGATVVYHRNPKTLSKQEGSGGSVRAE